MVSLDMKDGGDVSKLPWAFLESVIHMLLQQSLTRSFENLRLCYIISSDQNPMLNFISSKSLSTGGPAQLNTWNIVYLLSTIFKLDQDSMQHLKWPFKTLSDAKRWRKEETAMLRSKKNSKHSLL